MASGRAALIGNTSSIATFVVRIIIITAWIAYFFNMVAVILTDIFDNQMSPKTITSRGQITHIPTTLRSGISYRKSVCLSYVSK